MKSMKIKETFKLNILKHTHIQKKFWARGGGGGVV